MLDGLAPEELRQVLAIARRRTFRRGEVVFHMDDPADSLHLIVSGRFAVRVQTALGDVAILTVLGAGEMFGELALIERDGRRSATVEALEDAETRSIHRPEFERLRAALPQVAFMLVGILVLAFSANTFDIEVLSQTDFQDTLIPLGWVFFFLFVGFAVKLPIVPLHTWLPDAHSDAPTAVSVMLAGVLLKMGGYGLIRICITMLPGIAENWDVWFAAIGAAGVLYGAFLTLRQTDLKRLIAYSSVSHMGLVLLGIGALGNTGLVGATYQMLAHGLVTGLMFVMVGLMYERTHTREIARLGGLARQMPLIATGMVFAGFASLGLPALAGFIGEITVFLGTFQKYEWAVLMSIFGVVLSAGYVLWMLQRVVFGPVKHEWDGVTDQRHWWEHTVVIGLAALVILIGVYPELMTLMIEPAIDSIVLRIES